ncbi:MAG: alpha-ribazole phosphatase [Clostridia bacterium]|nr:alpha-ribazole phosphatase [Clostridia bacterium]
MGCKVILIRHGETVWNAVGKWQGHRDIPLSEKGLQQAEAVAQRLAGEKLDAVYCSDLQRARVTAEKIAQPHGLTVQVNSQLREMNFGQWEGLTYREIESSRDQVLASWCLDPITFRPPGGELVPEMAARVKAALQQIVAENQDKVVVVVCHGGPIRTFLAQLLGMDLKDNWRLRMDNVSLNIVEFSNWDNGILMLLNDRSHLV